MPLKLYNYLTRKVEQFKPIGDKKVGLYTCGPTVYDHAHIGNLRTFIFEDVLRKTLEFNGFDVNQVMNITDIDDKIIKRSKLEKVDLKSLALKFEKIFFEDLEKLNIQKAQNYPRATDHVNLMIEFIEKLIKKGFAYKGDDGIYFSVEKFTNYGQLSQLEKQNLKKGARVNDDLYDKESWSDFALWKFPSSAKATDGKPSLNEPSWDAPFGEGRPGWHIECSAMSMKYLGETFDIHTGGVDLLFPHHENEIAQNEALTGKKFVNYWLEGEHLLVDGQKMSKSLGNFYTLKDVENKHFSPLAFRYLILGAHYRSRLNFTWESLTAAQNALNNLNSEIQNWDDSKVGCAEFEQNFLDAVNDDLNTPQALAVLHQMISSDYPTGAKHQSILKMDQVLGLGLDKVEKQELPKEALDLIKKREELRKAGKFSESDKIRDQLASMRIEIEDTPSGTKWKVKK
ncbi:MAG TPA: cysteine--tRNA ligase [Patescibacteria group bacterium]